MRIGGWIACTRGPSRSTHGACAVVDRFPASLSAALRPRRHAEALQHGLRRDVGLLALDAPVFELVDRDRLAGDGAAHVGARPDDTDVRVEIFDQGLAAAFEPV